MELVSSKGLKKLHMVRPKKGECTVAGPLCEYLKDGYRIQFFCKKRQNTQKNDDTHSFCREGRSE